MRPSVSCSTHPLSLLPDPFTWDNYIKSWEAVRFPLAYWNSGYIAVLSVVGTLITSAMAGYAFARIFQVPRFRRPVRDLPGRPDDPQTGHADPHLCGDEHAGLVGSHLSLIVSGDAGPAVRGDF